MTEILFAKQINTINTGPNSAPLTLHALSLHKTHRGVSAQTRRKWCETAARIVIYRPSHERSTGARIKNCVEDIFAMQTPTNSQPICMQMGPPIQIQPVSDIYEYTIVFILKYSASLERGAPYCVLSRRLRISDDLLFGFVCLCARTVQCVIQRSVIEFWFEAWPPR